VEGASAKAAEHCKNEQGGESLWIGWHKSQRYMEAKKASLRANERVNRRFTAETKTAPRMFRGRGSILWLRKASGLKA